MGLLDRFRQRRPEPRQLRLLALPADGYVRVVGESRCQEALAQVATTTRLDADERRRFPAALLPEPDNPVDPDAIAVHSAAGRVGYLERERAQDFRTVMSHLRHNGYDGASCDAFLEGGVPGKPSYGVVLALSYPAACESHLGIAPEAAAASLARPESGFVRGRHYTEYPDQVRQLRRDGSDEEAEQLLLELVQATEREAVDQGAGWGVAPWYYEQLAIMYRKRKDYAGEVSVLERYAAQPHGPGVGPGKLDDRLQKARALLARTME